MTKTDFFNLFAEGIRTPERLTIEWVKQNVNLPDQTYGKSGWCDLLYSPYLIEPLRDFANPEVTEIYLAATPRTGKSLFEDILLLYVLKEMPSDVLLVLDTKQKANQWFTTRLERLFKANGIKLSSSRYDTTKNLIQLDNGNLIRFAGAQKETDLAGFPSKIVLGDECWNWSKSSIDKAKMRAKDFLIGKKTVFVSQASIAGSDFHRSWHRGNQSIYGFKCIACGKPQTYCFTKRVKINGDLAWAGLNWDPSAKEKNGKWNVQRAMDTCYYACEHCGHKYTDSYGTRKELKENYVYIPQTTEPKEKKVRSYGWNCFASESYPWTDIVSEWLTKANAGNKTDRKTFFLQWLTEFHSPAMDEEEIVPMVSNVSASLETVTEKDIRYLTADIQRIKDEKYFIGFNVNKESKTIDILQYGYKHTWNELETLRQDLKVKPRRVVVDSGYNTKTIYKECVLRGEWIQTTSGNIRWSCWLPTKGFGTDARPYSHPDGIKRFYSPPSPQSTGVNEDGKRKVNLCTFNADTAKDIAYELLSGKHADWTLRIPELASNDKDFIASLNSERVEKAENKRRGGYDEVWKPVSDFNHYWDCLVLLVVAMAKDKLL